MRHPNLSEEINDNIEKAESSGLLIKSLEKGDVVKVSTLEGNYTFTVTDPQKAMVVAEGGGFKKGGEEVYFAGSNWGGSMIKMNWVGPDTRIEAGQLILPWTTDIMLNDKMVLSSKGIQ